MHDSILMNIFDARDNLLHEPDRLGLVETLSLYDVVEELAALGVLHYEVDVGFCLDYLVQLDYVRVAEDF